MHLTKQKSGVKCIFHAKRRAERTGKKVRQKADSLNLFGFVSYANDGVLATNAQKEQ